MESCPIERCYWVEPGKLLAGEYPRHKDGPDRFGKLDSLLAVGVSLFMDLTEEGELLPYADRVESAAYQRFPIRDLDTPQSREQTRDILDAIDGHLNNGGIVYLHCWGGVGRTGTIVGCWLARHGRTGAAAQERLDKLWQHNPKSARRRSPETSEQRQYVRDWREPE